MAAVVATGLNNAFVVSVADFVVVAAILGALATGGVTTGFGTTGAATTALCATALALVFVAASWLDTRCRLA